MSSSFYSTNKSMVLTCFCWNHTPPFFSCKPAPCSPGRVSIRYQTSSITWVADTSTILPKKLQSFLVTSTTIPTGNVSLTILVNSFCNYHSYWKKFYGNSGLLAALPFRHSPKEGLPALLVLQLVHLTCGEVCCQVKDALHCRASLLYPC